MTRVMSRARERPIRDGRAGVILTSRISEPGRRTVTGRCWWRPAPLRRQVDPDGLHLGVLLEGVSSALSAEAALLVSAEGEAGIVEVVRVDPDRARLERLRRAQRLLDVARPDGGGEAVDGAVAHGDRVRLVLERQRGEHGTEDLFPGDRHPGCDAVEHRRL